MLRLAVGVLAATTGCIPALQNRVAGDAIPPNRLVAVPPQVLVHTMDFFDHGSVDDQPTAAVAGEAENVLRVIVNEKRMLFADRQALVACGLACARFFHWGGVATLEVGLQREQIRNYGFHSVSDWTFHADLSAVRAALGVDFTLFVALKQTRETTGRKIGFALGGSYTVGKQIDAACVADLHDGAMVWCTSLKDDSSDIGDPGRVAQVLRTLLSGLFAQPPPAS
jgi:hypothetical protein